MGGGRLCFENELLILILPPTKDKPHYEAKQVILTPHYEAEQLILTPHYEAEQLILTP